MTTRSFTDLVGCALPLQLAGMGSVSSVELASAVTDAGGLGMLGVAGISAAVVEERLAVLSKSTSGPVGANFIVPFLDVDAVKLASRRCRVVEFFYGDPDAALVDIVHDGGALASWQVGSADEAFAAVDAGCDLVVVQGIEAGGHVRGVVTLADVLASTVGGFPVPLVAAGGVGTASDVAAQLNAGASAVRVGTRFVAAEESKAHSAYVDALIEAAAGDTMLTEVFSLGWPNAPHRVLRSCVAAAEVASSEIVGTVSADGSEWPVPRFSTIPPTKDAAGNIDAMALYAGFSVDAVKRRQPAAEIVAEMFERV